MRGRMESTARGSPILPRDSAAVRRTSGDSSRSDSSNTETVCSLEESGESWTQPARQRTAQGDRAHYRARGSPIEQGACTGPADEDHTSAHACLGGSSCKAGSSLAASMDCWSSFWAESISARIVLISGSTEFRTSATACLNVRNASPSPSPKLCISPGEIPAGCAACVFIAACCACTRATASLLTMADGRFTTGFA